MACAWCRAMKVSCPPTPQRTMQTSSSAVPTACWGPRPWPCRLLRPPGRCPTREPRPCRPCSCRRRERSPSGPLPSPARPLPTPDRQAPSAKGDLRGCPLGGRSIHTRPRGPGHVQEFRCLSHLVPVWWRPAGRPDVYRLRVVRAPACLVPCWRWCGLAAVPCTRRPAALPHQHPLPLLPLRRPRLSR